VILLLNHPEVAGRSCDDCKRYVYDAETGKQATKRRADEYGEVRLLPSLRPPGGKTPCAACPKCQWSDAKTPEAGQRTELTARNQRALEMYYQRRAGGGGVAPSLRRKFGIIEEIFEDERRRTGRMMELMLRYRR